MNTGYRNLFISFILVSGLSLSQSVFSDTLVPSAKLASIENSVSKMGVKELNLRMNELQDEKALLETEQVNTQSPSRSKSIAQRLAEINAELSAISKALIAIVGVGAISALTDDGYNDNVPPVITIIGSNPATVELGATYTDAGATAFDAFHGETAVTTSGSVDTGTVGSNTITYTATDLDGNTATATRVVNVVDTTAPVVTVTGDNPASVELGGTYTDEGATATDASGDVTVVTTGTVDTDTLGTYTLTYTSTDASGNAGTATRTVNVADTVAPVFTSAATFTIDEGQTEVGTVTATDLQAITFTIDSSDLAITAAGVLSFIVAPDFESQANPVYDLSTYDFTAVVTATDASGNAQTQNITVRVRDVGGIDDNPATGTGTDTNTDTSTEGTDTDTDTDTSTGTGTGTDTSTSTSTGTSS